MLKYRMYILMASAVISLTAIRPAISAETGQSDSKAVNPASKDQYLQAVANITKLVNAGEKKDVGKAASKLKKDFPDFAGADVDAFIKAEKSFCKGQFINAAKRYDKLLDKFPGSVLYQAVLERQYAIGEAFLNGRRKMVLWVLPMKAYDEGIKIMEKISDRVGNAPIGIKAAIAVADNYERRDKLDEAYHKWSEISSRWPTGLAGKEALLGMARCKHAEYRGPKFNASNLVSAKSYYENFKLRYPQDAEALGIDKIIERINEQLANKYFDVAKYYEKTKSEESANLYYQMVLDNWPDSKAAKKARAIMDEKKSGNEKELKWEEKIMNSLEGLLL